VEFTTHLGLQYQAARLWQAQKYLISFIFFFSILFYFILFYFIYYFILLNKINWWG
jgi:hypothetical protein